jgi:hypothetical protein
VPWWEAPPVAAAGALVPAAAFALTLVALPFARRDGPRALAALVAALGLGFLAAFAWAGAELAVVHDDRFALDAPWWLRALLLVPAAWALGAAALAWRVARRPRTPYVVLVACAAVFAAWLWRWNLIIPHA